ncbi:hypothetical protein Hanom_Chr13g01239151 [Helianthus anomalus]
MSQLSERQRSPNVQQRGVRVRAPLKLAVFLTVIGEKLCFFLWVLFLY